MIAGTFRLVWDVRSAEVFLTSLHERGLLYHPENDAEDCLRTVSGTKIWRRFNWPRSRPGWRHAGNTCRTPVKPRCVSSAASGCDQEAADNRSRPCGISRPGDGISTSPAVRLVCTE